MEFKRAPIWAFAIAVGMLTGSSGWAQSPPVVEGPQMEAFFTDGPGGARRDSNVFVQGENPSIMMWMTGLTPRSEDDGIAVIRSHVEMLDPNGDTILELPTDYSPYYELLGPGAAGLNVNLYITGKPRFDAPYIVKLDATFQQTGQRMVQQKEIWWKPVEDFSIVNHRIGYDEDRTRAPGLVLQAGKDYVLRLAAQKFDLIDLAGKFQVTITGCDLSGRPLSDTAFNKEISARLDKVNDGDIVSVDFDIAVRANRAGNYLLHAMVKDLNSGKEAVRYIPISVVSVFPPEPPNATSPPPGKLGVEMLLTQGENGAARQNNHYYFNETIYAQMRITGLAQGDDGVRSVLIRAKATDEQGTVLYEGEIGPYQFQHFLGGDTWEVSLHQHTKYPREKSGKMFWTLDVVDQRTGAEGSITQEVEMNPDSDLHLTGHRFVLSGEGELPAGCILQACRPYQLLGEVVGLTRKNSSYELQSTVFGCDEQGNRLSNFELTSSGSVYQSRYSDTDIHINWNQAIIFNRPGRYVLRITIRDLHSGNTTTEDLPVVVISQKPEAGISHALRRLPVVR